MKLCLMVNCHAIVKYLTFAVTVVLRSPSLYNFQINTISIYFLLITLDDQTYVTYKHLNEDNSILDELSFE